MKQPASAPPESKSNQNDASTSATDEGRVAVSQTQGENLPTFLLTHLLDHMLESVVVTNAQGNIIQVNAAFTDITGYSAAEAIGQSARFMQSDHHDELFHQQMWQQIYDTGHWYGQIWNRRKTGEGYLQHLNISSVLDEQGQITHMIGLGQDLTLQQASQQLTPFFALEDPLTRLGNRHLLTSRLDEAIAQAKQNSSSVGLLVVDIGRLRAINEELGFAWGDAILRMQAKVLNAAVEPMDTLVRLQGDLFAIIRHTRGRTLSMAQFANKLLEVLAKPMMINGSQVQYVQPSIGIAVYPRDGTDTVSLLQAAEYAHGMAKLHGRGRFQFVNLSQHELHHRELLIEHSLQEALLSGDGLTLYYQPQVCPKTGHISALEALLRWQHPKFGYLSPAEFIPIAEQSGLSVALDRWVISQVCQQMALWLQQHCRLPSISINLGAKQLIQPDFARWIQECVVTAGVSATNIKLEVTENTLMEPGCAPIVDQLRGLGFRISLDDFGTGYSALASLHKFSFDELKIDRSFMLEASHSERALILLKTVAYLAHQFSLHLVVEGVETQAQLDLLADLGPLTVQGYYYYRPLSAAAVTPLLVSSAT